MRRLGIQTARLAAAAALLALAARLVGLQALIEQLRRVDVAWFALAVLAMAASQWASALRWAVIAAILGLKAPPRELRIAYAQAMAVNVVLPGATLGGDTLRSVRLQRLGNPLGESALSVLLDRGSGLWILCLLSLCAALALWGSGQLDGLRLPALALPGLAAGLDARAAVGLYACALVLALAVPFTPVRLPGAWASPGMLGRLLGRLAELHALTVSRAPALLRSLWSSVLVQALCGLSLWICLLAAGGTAGFWAVLAVAAPIFIAGAVPVSYGGFGARELAAVLAAPLVGIDGQVALAASALYGIAAVLLGVAAAPLLVLVRRG